MESAMPVLTLAVQQDSGIVVCTDLTMEAFEVGKGREYTKLLKLIPFHRLHTTPAEAQKQLTGTVSSRCMSCLALPMYFYFISAVILNDHTRSLQPYPEHHKLYIPEVRSIRDACTVKQVANFA